jgi:epoxide hydrolase-like predicted phosphatase
VSPIEAIISDFGGVLTSPLLDVFKAINDASGLAPEDLGKAIGSLYERTGENPLFELETGRTTEAAFLSALDEELAAAGLEGRMHSFGEAFFAHLHPNERMIGYMRELRERGYRLAICTNNVREWESRWRAMLPIDELFELVVDSAFVGTRKPERRIYELTLERLGVPAEAALFIDDVELNCDGARDIGIRAVWFQDAEQAIGEIEAALAQ